MFSFVYGPNNVYADLGFEDAEDIPLKAGIVKEIAGSLRAAGISLTEAAALLRLPQSDLAVMLCGKLQHFRVEELRRWQERLRAALAC